MDFLSGIRVEKFEALATKTANCLLGFECGEEDNNNQGSLVNVITGQNTDGTGQNTVGTRQNTVGTGQNTVAGTIQNTAVAGKGPGQGKKTAEEANKELTSTIEKMNAEARQVDMNRKSKGPYFMIFILFMLLSAFSLGDEEEKE